MLQRWSAGSLVATGLFVPLLLGWPKTGESSNCVEVVTTDQNQCSIGLTESNVSRSKDRAIVTATAVETTLPTDSELISRSAGPSEMAASPAHRLVFRKATLAEMAAEFNRYNLRLQIQVKDEVGRSGRYSGVFDADSPESLLEYLARDPRFTLRRTGANVVVGIRPDFKNMRPGIVEAMSRN